MAKVRKIARTPPTGDRHYFLVDACFLANKHIPERVAPSQREKERLVACHTWWREIETMVEARTARVYVPDICIAEAFKVLAKKYYMEDWFKRPVDLQRARKALSEDLRTSTKELRSPSHFVRYHDISTNRDIIIGVDRYYELFMARRVNVSIPDLIVLATARYLLQYYDIPKDRLHIVTMDTRLRESAQRAAELPNAFDPTLRSHRAEVVFS
jgi:predicted nucleic acid-binding protein